MNFLPATIEGDTAKLPMVDVKLPQEVRRARSAASTPGKKLIAGIRPEDFEDAAHGAPPRPRAAGTTFKTKFDLVEAMGAEYYVHFGAGGSSSSPRRSRTCWPTRAASPRPPTRATRSSSRGSTPRAKVKVGEPTEVWIDATKLHFFDADSGQSLTSARSVAG